MDQPRRVVVTGMGVVCSLGFDTSTLWENMIAGRSGIAQLGSFDYTGYKCRVGAEIDGDELGAAMKHHKLWQVGRSVDMGLVAAAQALSDAGIVTEPKPTEQSDIATIFSCHGSFRSIYHLFLDFMDRGLRSVRPSSLPRHIPNAAAAQISLAFKLRAANYVVASACSGSSVAMGVGMRMIRHGYADKVLTGGTDSVFDPFIFAGWNGLGALSPNPDPLAACRPFDSARDGTVLGEGAGALLLESLESAQSRGAAIHAELCGYGESSDAKHLTRPDSEGQARAVRAALDDSDMAPDEIGFINAHGTATKSNDSSEAAAIRSVLGPRADTVPVGANKSYFGHLTGAGGAVECIVSILGLQKGVVPPKLNLDRPDPECNLRFVGPEPMAVESPILMKNSFGFGGNNAVLVLRRWDEE